MRARCAWSPPGVVSSEDRRRYANAWSSWSRADDERLLDSYRSGMDVDQLADELGRKPRAIVSRLVKHGLVAQDLPDRPNQALKS